MGDVYYKLDKKSREELISTVKRVAIEILEGPQENWITADEVSGAYRTYYNSVAKLKQEFDINKKKLSEQYR